MQGYISFLPFFMEFSRNWWVAEVRMGLAKPGLTLVGRTDIMSNRIEQRSCLAMFCRFCGKEIQGQKAFCPYCGKQLTQQSAQQASVPVTAASKQPG